MFSNRLFELNIWGLQGLISAIWGLPTGREGCLQLNRDPPKKNPSWKTSNLPNKSPKNSSRWAIQVANFNDTDRQVVPHVSWTEGGEGRKRFVIPDRSICSIERIIGKEDALSNLLGTKVWEQPVTKHHKKKKLQRLNQILWRGSGVSV
jgi:hypothetical protein